LRSVAPRVVALAIVVGVAALGVALLAASLLPSGVLGARLLGAAGEAERSGSHTADLLAHFGDPVAVRGRSLPWPGHRHRTVAQATRRCARGDVHGRACGVGRLGNRQAGVSTGWRSRSSRYNAWRARLRLAFIQQPMRYDEALTFNELASRPLYYGLSSTRPEQPPAHTLLVHLAYVGLGNQPWVLRLPRWLAGVLLVPATYAWRRHCRRHARAPCWPGRSSRCPRT